MEGVGFMEFGSGNAECGKGRNPQGIGKSEPQNIE
jgi:hypothetical protein